MSAAETAIDRGGEDAPQPALPQREIFWRFLQFGAMAWGGPVAQLGMLRRELVERERWISSTRFNRLLAILQILPGPEAHEMCVYLGTMRGGTLGGVLAGLAFMLPGFVLMFALSWLYVEGGIATAALAGVFLGMQPAVIALIVRAVHRIGAHILTGRWLWTVAAVTLVASLVGVRFWWTLLIAGLGYTLLRRSRPALAACVFAIGVAAPLASGRLLDSGSWSALQPATEPSLATHAAPAHTLFLSGLKAGLLTFGGAYTAIPFLRDDAVGNEWMTQAQFVDGLALSGVLPAPLIIFSTFVGYVGGGPFGALAMTTGIFLPAFLFGIFLHGRLGRVAEDDRLQAALEGVAAGVIGLIAATALQLAVAVMLKVPSRSIAAVIFLLSLWLLYAWNRRITVPFILLGAGLLGWTLW